jgi:hypothetical protein
MSISRVSVQSDGMSALIASGDVGAEVAALAVETGETQRQDAQVVRDEMEASAAAEEDQEVAAMRDKADAIRNAGIAEGIGMGLDGVCNIVAGPCSSGAQTSLKGGGMLAEGTGKIVGACFSADGATADANATRHKVNADHAKDVANDAHDELKGASEYVNSAIDFYREYVSAQGQTMSAALHRA